MRQKLTLITLGVRDLETSLKFYRDGLGWKPSSASQGDIIFFDLGGIGLALYPRNLLLWERGGSRMPRLLSLG